MKRQHPKRPAENERYFRYRPDGRSRLLEEGSRISQDPPWVVALTEEEEEPIY